MRCNRVMGGMFGGGLLGLPYFAIGVFIFAAIFLLTYNWLAEKKR